MALNESDFIRLRSSINNAAKALCSDELIYQTEWVFQLPTATLKIANVALHEQFDIPVGLTGYGEDDLSRLADEGFLTVLREDKIDEHEKTVFYKINAG